MAFSRTAKDLLSFNPVILTAKITDFDTGLLEGLLSSEEVLRMRRFRQDADAQRYIVAHALKRYFLSQYLDLAPEVLNFSKNKFGKPFCTQKNAPYFNISHSGDWVVLAMSLVSGVGVDIEFPRPGELMPILQRVCSVEQLEVYQQSNTPMETFLCLWSQKEAISKANGRGIGVGLANIGCSGCIGHQKICFLSENYHLYSFFCPNNGVLTYASTIDEQPELVHLKGLDVALNSMSWSFFDL